VRYTNGYELAVDRRFQVADGISLGPVVQVANGFVNAHGKDGGATVTANYDDRIVAAGARLGVKVGNAGTLAQEVYLNALAGRGFSKVAVDRTDASSYGQRLFNNISGDYWASELGAVMPLKSGLGLTFALDASRYRADQSKATGTEDASHIGSDGNLYL